MNRVDRRVCVLERLEPRVLLDGGPQAQAIEVFAASPAVFVQNAGQWADPAVRYAFHGNGGSVLHTDAGPVLQLSRPPGQGREDQPDNHRLAVHFDDARAVGPVGLDRSGASFNFYLGQQSTWRTDVPGYETVAYRGLYEGIDLYTRGQADGLKYEFRVAAGGDYSKIRLSYEGITALAVDGTGALHVQTPLGELVDDAPYVYQQIGARTVRVPGCFRLLDAETYGFSIRGPYDPARELVIDPSITWSSYLGGASKDNAWFVSIDANGDYRLYGVTTSVDFPTTAEAFDDTYNGGGQQGWDVFLTKVSSSGQLVWSTYFGGNGDDACHGHVDEYGNVFLSGYTDSTDLPVTSGAHDTTYNGGQDAFLAKFTSAGLLHWSTYLGGSGFDEGGGFEFDASGNLLVVGQTASDDFPTTAGAFDETYNGGSASCGDVYAAKFTRSGDLVWSSFLGGWGDDRATGFDLGPAGGLWITGQTDSIDFPTTPGAFGTTHNGGQDVFVTKLSGLGQVLWSSYMGGTADDVGGGFQFDAAGDAVLDGQTASDDFPAFNAYDTTFNGGYDAFIGKIASDGQVQWATFLGGGGVDSGSCLGFDAVGDLVITGSTSSADFPTTTGAFDESYNGGSEYGGDLYVAKLTASGQQLMWSTYLGGSEDDSGGGLAVDAAGGILLGGYTLSDDFPTVEAIDETYNGGESWGDVFLARMTSAGQLTWCTYLGGGGDEGILHFELDQDDNIVVPGWTSSDDFPTTPGALDETYNGGDWDGFVVKISMAGPRPDLLVADTTPTSLAAEPAATVTLQVTTANPSNVDLHDKFNTVLYLNDVNDFSTVGEENKVAEHAFAGLEAGESSADAYAFTAPAAPGTYYLRAKADDGDSVGEANEANNWGPVVTLTVGEEEKPPNLVGQFGTIELAEEIVPGEKSKLPVIVTNAGDGPADGRIDIDVYASTDEALDDGDVPLGRLTGRRLKLDPDEARAFTVKLAVPDDLPPGTYYLLAEVDSADDVAETDEDDNLAVAEEPVEVVWKFGGFAGRKNVKLTVQDQEGTPVTFALTGGGWGEVAGGSALAQVTLHQTTAGSKLTVATKGKGLWTEIGDIIADDGPLNSIKAKTADLLGDLTAAVGLGKLVLRDVADDHTITIGPSGDPKAAVSMTFRRVADTSILSEIPIRSLAAMEWLDTDATADRVEAPRVDKLTIKGSRKDDIAGDFQADLILDPGEVLPDKGTLASAKIAGDLDGCDWDITGRLGKLTVGGTVRDSTIRSTRCMLGIKLGAAEGTDFLAGIKGAVVRHAQTGDDFDSPDVTVRSFKIKGLKPPKGEAPRQWFFSDSNVSAGWIGSVKLLNVEFENEGDPFGFWACDSGPDVEIKSVKWSDKVDKDVKGKWSPKDPQPPPPDLAIETLS